MSKALLGGRVCAICHAELPTKAAQIRQLCLLAPLPYSARNEGVRGVGRGRRRKDTHTTRVPTAGVRNLAPLDHGNVQSCGGGGTVVGNTVGGDLYGHRHVCVVELHPSLEAELALPFLVKGKVDPVDVAIIHDCSSRTNQGFGLLHTNFRRQCDAQRHIGSSKLKVRLLDQDFDVKAFPCHDEELVLLVSLGRGGDCNGQMACRKLIRGRGQRECAEGEQAAQHQGQKSGRLVHG